MHFKANLLLTALLAGSRVLADSQCGETSKQVCFGKDGGQSQDIDPDDIAYLAGYLREKGTPKAEGDAPIAWTMPPTKSYDCQEWTVFQAGTAMALIKHITPKLNSSILQTDIANTIDGGDGATGDALKKSLLGACGKGGGMVGVTVTKDAPYYASKEFKNANNSPDGIIVKLVRAPGS